MNSYSESIVSRPRLLTPPVLIAISSSQSPLLSVSPVRCMDTANFINVEVRVSYGFPKHNVFGMKAKELFVVVWIVEEIGLENRQRVSSARLSNILSLSLHTQRQCKLRGGSSGSLVLLLFTRFSWDCTEFSLYGSSEVYRLRPDILGRFAHSPARMFLDAVPSKGLTIPETVSHLKKYWTVIICIQWCILK